MTHCRLNNLFLLYVHQSKTDSLDLESLDIFNLLHVFLAFICNSRLLILAGGFNDHFGAWHFIYDTLN